MTASIPLFLNTLGATAAPDGPLPAVLFYLFAGTTAIGGLSVALAKNIVRAAVGLLFALGGMSGLYLLLNAEFIAAVQLVVYVGGTLILIVFGVMLTSKSPHATYAPKRFEVVWALIVAAMVAVPLMTMLASANFPLVTASSASTTTATSPATPTVAAITPPSATSATPTAPAASPTALVQPADSATGVVGQTYAMSSLGRALLEPTGYLVPFELVSVLLLAVMIGAAYLAKGRKPAASGTPGDKA